MVKNLADFKVSRSLLLVHVLGWGASPHINGWNVAQGDMSVRFVIDPTILEDMRNSTGFIDNDFVTWDLVMDKLRQ